MTKHINDLIQKSIDVPSEKLIIEYVIENKRLEKRIEELEQQIEKMKCDVLSLIKDRMNDDIDQNIIERLAEKWEIEND